MLQLANQPFLARSVFLQRVENIPSVQSLVETSSRPNICGAVMALGFILISLCGVPQSVIAFINRWMQAVLPAPLGPRTIIPWRTRWVSNSCKISFHVYSQAQKKQKMIESRWINTLWRDTMAKQDARLQSSHGGNLKFTNMFDTKSKRFPFPPTRHYSLLRN